MPATGADSKGVDENLPTEAPQLLTVVQVPVNIFTGTLQGIIGFTSTQVWVLVDDGYDSQESVLCGKFKDIKEWCQLKSKIPTIRGGVSYGDRKIKCIQALAWWVKDLTLQGNILSDAIKVSLIDFEDTRYGKGGLSKPKDFSHENWTQWEDSI